MFGDNSLLGGNYGPLSEALGKKHKRLIIDARVSNLHFLPPPGVSLVTSEGLSRVEVAFENDDEDPGELSILAGLHLGLADVKDALNRETVQLLLLPSLRCKVRKWEPL